MQKKVKIIKSVGQTRQVLLQNDFDSGYPRVELQQLFDIHYQNRFVIGFFHKGHE